MKTNCRAVFLDRDGTLNIEREYLCDPGKLELFPDVVESLARLRDAGFRMFVVTNQSGIGRGYYSETDMHKVNTRLTKTLSSHGIDLEKIYYAPEAPEQPSRGRKPSPQFLFDARDEFGIDLVLSYLIGDKVSDLECGWRAGVRKSLLVRTGYGRLTEERHPEIQSLAVIVDDMAGAVDVILSDAAEGKS